MEDIKEKISEVIDKEYYKALKRGILDANHIADSIFNLLLDYEIINVSVPESACGCCEILET